MQVLQQQQLLQSAGGVYNLSSILQNTAGETALLVAGTVKCCGFKLLVCTKQGAWSTVVRDKFL